MTAVRDRKGEGDCSDSQKILEDVLNHVFI